MLRDLYGAEAEELLNPASVNTTTATPVIDTLTLPTLAAAA